MQFNEFGHKQQPLCTQSLYNQMPKKYNISVIKFEKILSSFIITINFFIYLKL